jgi:hemolysin D
MNGRFNGHDDVWINRHIQDEKGEIQVSGACFPSVMEIEATPPNSIMQWLARSIGLLFLSCLFFAFFGEVNVVASAQGKILSESLVKVIQPLKNGVIKRILVAEGENVSKGQMLIELDVERTNTNKQEHNGELIKARIKLAVNEVLLDKLNEKANSSDQIEVDSLDAVQWSEGAGSLKKQSDALLQEKWFQYHTRIAALVSALEASDEEYETTKIEIGKLKKNLSIITKSADIARELHKEKYAAETGYLQFEQTRKEQTQKLTVEKQHLTQLQAMREQAQRQIDTLKIETRAGILTEISENRREITVLQEELIKENDPNLRHIIYAPLAGAVRQLTTKSVGGVVTEAEPLMQILSDEGPLVVEVFLENKDIGFVEKNMPAAVKINSTVISNHSTIQAEVERISDDAVFDEKRGYVHSMLLAMKSKIVEVDGQTVRLLPGMEVTAEVKTGEQRFIEYLLSSKLQ